MYSQVNSASNGAWTMRFGSFDGGGDGEHNRVELVEISKIPETILFLGEKIRVDKIYLTHSQKILPLCSAYIAPWNKHRSTVVSPCLHQLQQVCTFTHVFISLATQHIVKYAFSMYRIHSNRHPLGVSNAWGWCKMIGSKFDLKYIIGIQNNYKCKGFCVQRACWWRRWASFRAWVSIWMNTACLERCAFRVKIPLVVTQWMHCTVHVYPHT